MPGPHRRRQFLQHARHQRIDARQLLDFRGRPADNHACAPSFFATSVRSCAAGKPSADATAANQRLAHLFGRLQPVDHPERRPGAVVLDHRPRVAPVDLQPFANHRFRIVRPRHPLRADRPAPFGVLAQFRQRVGLVLEGVGVGAAVVAHPPAAHAPNQFLVGHLDLDADHRPARRRYLVQRGGLPGRAREAVEHEARHRIRPHQPLADDPDDQVVAHQLAPLHHGFHR